MILKELLLHVFYSCLNCYWFFKLWHILFPAGVSGWWELWGLSLSLAEVLFLLEWERILTILGVGHIQNSDPELVDLLLSYLNN